MKRRSFVQSLLVVPAAPAAVALPQAANTQSTPQTTPQQQPPPQPNTPARQTPRQPPAIPKLEVTQVDVAGQAAPHFFNAAQFATLRKLSSVLVPPLKGNPGALEAQAPEFLDFLVSVSPADRQKLYISGLDHLDLLSRSKVGKSFAEAEPAQADLVLRPLLTIRPWPEDLPEDPLKNFVAQVHEDLRTATTNSREWAEASEKLGHRFTRGFRGSGYYWAPIDPISES